MKKISLFLLTIFSFFGCMPEDHFLEVVIQNNSSQPLRDLEVITAGGKVSFSANVLPAGEDIGHVLEVKEQFVDGKYTFRFLRSNNARETATGSYLEQTEAGRKKTITFKVQEDEIEVE